MPKTGLDQLKLLMYQTLNQFNRYDYLYGKNSKDAERSLKQLNILIEVHEEYKNSLKRERESKKQ